MDMKWYSIFICLYFLSGLLMLNRWFHIFMTIRVSSLVNCSFVSLAHFSYHHHHQQHHDHRHQHFSSSIRALQVLQKQTLFRHVSVDPQIISNELAPPEARAKYSFNSRTSSWERGWMGGVSLSPLWVVEIATKNPFVLIIHTTACWLLENLTLALAFIHSWWAECRVVDQWCKPVQYGGFGHGEVNAQIP